MTDSTRTKLAALAVALFLAGVSVAGALNHTQTPAAPVGGQVATSATSHPAPVPSRFGENND